MSKLDASKAHLEGHRGRLRDRFLETGGGSLAAHEVLELLLFGVLPRQDTKLLAKNLLAQFGSLLGVVGAPIADLMRVPGVGQVVAIHLKSVHEMMARASWEDLEQAVITDNEQKILLGSWSSVLGYLRIKLASLKREEFRVLFLSKSHRLLKDELMGEGTVDQAPVYPREIARRALELSASNVILTHNHPSGDPSPSAADIAMTREIIAALKPLGIGVIDHVIIGNEGSRSLKALGMF